MYAVYDCLHACLVISLGTTLPRKSTFAVPASLAFCFLFFYFAFSVVHK